MLKSAHLFAILILSICCASAQQIKVATLNAYLLFDPAVEHVGKVDEESRMSPAEYEQKTANLARLASGYDFIGLQEVGGRAEIERLARAAGKEWGFAKGRDTATGEEVGAIFRLPGWRISVDGRVGALDRALSKHLLITARNESRVVRFLVCHLVRPIGQRQEKHAQQIAAVREWAESLVLREPKTVIAIVGDMNDSEVTRGSSLFGVGREAGESLGYPPTHLSKHHLDRLVVVGPASWTRAEVSFPPYGPRPNQTNKRLWTDHALLGAVLNFE